MEINAKAKHSLLYSTPALPLHNWCADIFCKFYIYWLMRVPRTCFTAELSSEACWLLRLFIPFRSSCFSIILALLAYESATSLCNGTWKKTVYSTAAQSKTLFYVYEQAMQQSMQPPHYKRCKKVHSYSEIYVKTYRLNFIFLFIYCRNSDRRKLSHVLGVTGDEDTVLRLVLHLLCHWLAPTLDYTALGW